MTTENGGPAFPMQFNDIKSQTGMSLREYFAAKAMLGFIAELGFNATVTSETIADASYHMADAMLKAMKQ